MDSTKAFTVALQAAQTAWNRTDQANQMHRGGTLTGALGLATGQILDALDDSGVDSGKVTYLVQHNAKTDPKTMIADMEKRAREEKALFDKGATIEERIGHARLYNTYLATGAIYRRAEYIEGQVKNHQFVAPVGDAIKFVSGVEHMPMLNPYAAVPGIQPTTAGHNPPPPPPVDQADQAKVTAAAADVVAKAQTFVKADVKAYTAYNQGLNPAAGDATTLIDNQLVGEAALDRNKLPKSIKDFSFLSAADQKKVNDFLTKNPTLKDKLLDYAKDDLAARKRQGRVVRCVRGQESGRACARCQACADGRR